MEDVARFTGIAQFGRAYQRMLEQDPHAPGSVDRVLLERMIRLCPETVEYLYTRYTPPVVQYPPGTRPILEQVAWQATTGCPTPAAPVDGLIHFTATLAAPAAERPWEAFVFGGTEEAILQRGSDWCTDVARVACLLCQVLGLPARLVYLFNTAQAYSGHVIIEVYDTGEWGAADAVQGLVYRRVDGRPLSVWDLRQWVHQEASLAESVVDWGSAREQFREAAVVNYGILDAPQYSYVESGLNAYTRSILEMSSRGWPGGLRWLHQEDQG